MIFARPEDYDTMCDELERFAHSIELEKIQCPAMICHGTKDGDVPFSQAEAANQRIPNATLYPVEGGYHLLCIDEKYGDLFRAQVAFAWE